jgi:hypothetical protein
MNAKVVLEEYSTEKKVMPRERGSTTTSAFLPLIFRPKSENYVVLLF